MSNTPGLMVRLENAPVLRARGADVVDLLQRVGTNDVAPLAKGSGVCTVFTTEKGRIAECCHVVPLSEQQTYVFFLWGCLGGDFREWISRYIIMEDAALDEQPVAPSHWMVFEPGFGPVKLGSGVLDRLRDSGFLAVSEHYRDRHWMRIADMQSDGPSERLLGLVTDVRMADWSDFERERISAGIPMAGQELTDSFNPLEAQLREYISFSKGCYVGQEVIARLDSYKKVSRVLARVRGAGTGRTGLITAGGKDAGVITSVTQVSPTEWRGLAYVREQAVQAGTLDRADGEGTIELLDPDPFKGAYSLTHG